MNNEDKELTKEELEEIGITPEEQALALEVNKYYANTNTR